MVEIEKIFSVIRNIKNLLKRLMRHLFLLVAISINFLWFSSFLLNYSQYRSYGFFFFKLKFLYETFDLSYFIKWFCCRFVNLRNLNKKLYRLRLFLSEDLNLSFIIKLFNSCCISTYKSIHVFTFWSKNNLNKNFRVDHFLVVSFNSKDL